jgi:PAT family beta-lactamase induction signal transducer AmpG
MTEATNKNPWWWIPTLYYTQGIPYIMVVTVSVIMYKDLGISNTQLALFTSILALPWALKPLWSPFIDVFKTKRWWTFTMQGIIGLSFAGAAVAMNTPYFFEVSLGFLFLVAFASSTHDIAADGFYMLALSDEKQSFFVGIRSTFFRLAMWSGEGLFVVLAGILATRVMDSAMAWTLVLGMVAVIMIVMFAYHQKMLPYPGEDKPAEQAEESPLQAVWSTIAEFFKKEQIGLAVTFVLLYRFGEGQLVKLAAPFLMDTIEAGGLGLSVVDVGYINGVIGLLALTAGGILGGIVISKHGLKAWLWPMIGIMNLPNLSYWYLAAAQPDNFWVISGFVGLEKFGYGFGFTAFLMYLIYLARGPFKTAHYAFGTALMAFGMSIPGAISGAVQEAIGYELFFIWVLLSAVPIVIITPFIRIESDFGKKKEAES